MEKFFRVRPALSCAAAISTALDDMADADCCQEESEVEEDDDKDDDGGVGRISVAVRLVRSLP